MKKKALSALVLGSLCAQASQMIQNPSEQFGQMGTQQRFGDRIHPSDLIDPKNHPPAQRESSEAAAPSQAAQKPDAQEPPKPPANSEAATPQRPDPSEAIAPDPFGDRDIPLTCGARCGIPLKDYSDSSEG